MIKYRTFHTRLQNAPFCCFLPLYITFGVIFIIASFSAQRKWLQRKRKKSFVRKNYFNTTKRLSYLIALIFIGEAEPISLYNNYTRARKYYWYYEFLLAIYFATTFKKNNHLMKRKEIIRNGSFFSLFPGTEETLWFFSTPSFFFAIIRRPFSSSSPQNYSSILGARARNFELILIR